MKKIKYFYPFMGCIMYFSSLTRSVRPIYSIIYLLHIIEISLATFGIHLSGNSYVL